MMLIFKAVNFLVIAIMVFFFGFTAQGVSIKGNFKNTGGSNWIYIYQNIANEISKIDSSKLSSGNIKYDASLPKGLYKLGISEEKSFNMILAGESLEVTADFADLQNSIKILGSKENELYSIINRFNIKFNEEFGQLDKKAQPILAIRGSDPQKFNTEIKKLQVQLDSLNQDRSKFFKKFSEENKSFYASKLATPFIIDEKATKADFFSSAELKDPDYARSDALSTKILIYFQRFAGQQLPQLQEEAAYLLGLPTPGSLNKEAFYISIIKIFSPYDLEYANALTNMYTKEFPKSSIAAKIKSQLPKGAPQVGDLAPDIKLTNPNGKVVSLSSFKGKVVLIDFWASWCGPCRMENPNVVKAYQKYKDKGFTIYSVSLDENKDKWMQAIQKDGLVWDSHVSDLKGWSSSAAQLYHVKGIPATFLIGKDGRIIGTNLRGQGLESKLEQLYQ